jgi:hypothetical protein
MLLVEGLGMPGLWTASLGTNGVATGDKQHVIDTLFVRSDDDST